MEAYLSTPQPVVKKTRVVNVKVQHIRPAHDNIYEWMKDPNNLYIGRGGRIFIGSGPDKYAYGYPSSKWSNPFKISESQGRDAVVKKYRDALFSEELKDENGVPLIRQVAELKGKNIGCWCAPEGCHGDTLAELANSNKTSPAPAPRPANLKPTQQKPNPQFSNDDFPAL
jgi:hypothetical protein